MNIPLIIYKKINIFHPRKISFRYYLLFFFIFSIYPLNFAEFRFMKKLLYFNFVATIEVTKIVRI